jgi:MoxR-like ATPase
MPLFVSVKISNAAEAAVLHKQLQNGPTTLTIAPFKQAPQAAAPGTIAFLGLGGDDTGGKLPYVRGWYGVGRITRADHAPKKGEIDRLDIELVHTLKAPLDRKAIEDFSQFEQEFQTLPHWGLRHPANQTVQPIKSEATARALIVAYCVLGGDGTKELLVGKLPELQQLFETVAIPTVDLPKTVESLANSLLAAHLSYGSPSEHLRFVGSFLAAMATKPFALLTGHPGTGKTQLALRFGDWLSYGTFARDTRVLVLPVRPDWTGSEYLFGYVDVLQPVRDGRPGWNVPRALEFMLRASQDAENPYLMILDEMNLAHVERYFSDLLSGLESREPVLPNLDREDDGIWRHDPDGPTYIPVPRNVFVIGTINIDETTHSVSPKVLDRAAVFDFRVETAQLSLDLKAPVKAPAGPPELVRGYLSVSSDDNYQFKSPPQWLADFVKEVAAVHELLFAAGMEFSKRVFYESIRFASLRALSGNADLESVLDDVLLQRLLPRLHGARRRMEPVLCGLARYAATGTTDLADLGRAAAGGAKRFDPEAPASSPRLKGSFQKLARMTKAVRENQYVSFIE